LILKFFKIHTLRKIGSGFLFVLFFVIFEGVRDVGDEFGDTGCKDRLFLFLYDDGIDELDGEGFLSAFFGVILDVSEGDVNEEDVTFLDDFVRGFNDIQCVFPQEDTNTKPK
jgi:hypothetical protein